MLDDEARNGSCNEAHQIRILVGLYSGNVRYIHTRRSRKITHDIHVLACKLHFDNMPPWILHKSCSPGKKIIVRAEREKNLPDNYGFWR